MNDTLAMQLMIGRDEIASFGEDGILRRLREAVDILGFAHLFLYAEDPGSDLARRVVDYCRGKGAAVALWTMVMADSGRGGRPAADASGRQGYGRQGYGRLGSWSGLGKGPESFLFTCPADALEDESGPAAAIGALARSGADALFLDRLRYSSPANGLELLGSCGCEACRALYRRETDESWPDLARLASDCAREGAAGAERFLAEARSALAFRARTVGRIAARYEESAASVGARVGLDLFSPALGPLVGVDYGLLGAGADFIKGMLYCKARGPAGLPLEIDCLIRGLVGSGVDEERATAFASGILGIPEHELRQRGEGRGLPESRAAAEYARARAALAAAGGSGPKLFAGIELVDHPSYDTRISGATRDRYLAALSGVPVALCWNLLYIPPEHMSAVADFASRRSSADRRQGDGGLR